MVSINAQSSERTANPLVFAWRIVSIRLVFELQRVPIVDRVVSRDSHCYDCLQDGAYQAFDENEVNQPRRSLLMDNYRMQFSLEDRLFVLSGTGISAEGGLATFRGSGGLWNGHRVEEVATPEAWDADPELVWRFYSMRRRDVRRICSTATGLLHDGTAVAGPFLLADAPAPASYLLRPIR
jgi:hypothetical protein